MDSQVAVSAAGRGRRQLAAVAERCSAAMVSVVCEAGPPIVDFHRGGPRRMWWRRMVPKEPTERAKVAKEGRSKARPSCWPLRWQSLDELEREGREERRGQAGTWGGGEGSVAAFTGGRGGGELGHRAFPTGDCCSEDRGQGECGKERGRKGRAGALHGD